MAQPDHLSSRQPRLPSAPRSVAVWIGSAAFTLAAATAPDPATAATIQLSQGLPYSNVRQLLVSPNGSRVVYVQDAVLDQAHELWSVPTGGGAPVRLSGLLPQNVAVEAAAITPDSQRVVYLAAQDLSGIAELFSVSGAGPEGSWVRVNAPLEAGEVDQFEVAASSTRVVYTAGVRRTDLGGGATDWRELYSVPIGGGEATLLATGLYQENPLVPRHRDFWIAPNASRVVYQDASQHELRSVPIGGGSAVGLTAGLAGGGWGVSFSADSQWVVYLAGDPVRLYSVPITGGAPRQLNGAMVAGGAVRQFAISPSSQWVVYAADQQVDEVTELYAVPIADGPVVKLSPAMIAGGDVSAAPLLISADSTRVIYSADQEADDRTELWSVALAGGAATKLNGPLVTGGDVRRFALAGPTATVVYEADQTTDQSWELYAAPVVGGASRRVSRPPRGLNPGPLDSTLETFTPDGTRAVYRQRNVTGSGLSRLETETILSTLLATGVSTVVSPTAQPGSGESLRFAAATPDPTRVVYVFSQGSSGEDEVFLTDF